jgi:hypothetical protein
MAGLTYGHWLGEFLWGDTVGAHSVVLGGPVRRSLDPPVAPVLGVGWWGVESEFELKFGLVAAGGFEPPTYRV